MSVNNLLSFLLLFLFAAPTVSAIEIDITKHPDGDIMIGYKKKYQPDCDINWFESRWGSNYIMGSGDCDGVVTEKQVMDDLLKEIELVKNYTGAENFSDYYAIKEMGGPDNRLPKEYWAYMNGYRYEYGKGCTIRWINRASTFNAIGDCSGLSNDRLKADAIKSINYAKSVSNVKDFEEYYKLPEIVNQQKEAKATQLATKKKTQQSASGYTIEQSRVDAYKLWYFTCSNRKSFNIVPFNEMAAKFPGIGQMHAARLYRHANAQVEMMGGMVDCGEGAKYAIQLYTTDIDIRANGQQYSIEQAGKDSREIWRLSCIDAKEERPSRLNALLAQFNKIEKAEVTKLHRNAYAAVDGIDRLAAGNINCDKSVDIFFPNPYVPEKDIRLKEYQQ